MFHPTNTQKVCSLKALEIPYFLRIRDLQVEIYTLASLPCVSADSSKAVVSF